MATFNPTAKQIIEIHEIFNKIVDCKGNLKVFRNFDWKAQCHFKQAGRLL